MSDTILPKGALRPAEHVVRNMIVDLGMIDAPDAGYDDVLEPGFWSNLAPDLKVGDEVRILASDRSWERTVRVESVGPAGSVVQHIDGKRATSLARQVYLCRERKDAEHMFAVYVKEGEDWTRLAPGQTSLMALAEELDALITREPNADFTLSPYDIGRIKELGSDDQAACDTTILLPEGTPDRDSWRIAYRDKFGVRVAARINRRTVCEEIRNFFWGLSGNPYGTDQPEWRRVETDWRPATSDWLLIRPNWNARQLWPQCFPEPPKFSEEYERAAAVQREKSMAKRKSNLARERAAENARVSSEIDARQREAVHLISRKFE